MQYNTKSAISRGFSRGPALRTILGPLEKSLEIADFVFYCIKNG
jgi:hypothetical protein